MRLIDADELRKYLINKAKDIKPSGKDNFYKYGFACGLVQTAKKLEEFHKVDAVPVVRCKDCEYGKVSDTKGYVWCTCYEIHKLSNGFCEYGEWKKWKVT